VRAHQDLLLLEVTPRHILARLDQIESATRYNRVRKELNAFFHWAALFHQTLKHPVLVKPRPEEPKPQPVPSEEEVVRPLMSANTWHRALLLAYLCTGGRRSEVARWRWDEDIDFGMNLVRLGSRKGTGEMRYRWVEMEGPLRDVLMEMWNRRQDNGYVWPSRASLTTVLHRICKRAGTRQYGVHSLRRWFTSMLADRFRTSLPVLQKLLGHTRSSRTSRYIYNVSEDSRAAISMLSRMEVFNAQKALDAGKRPGSVGDRGVASPLLLPEVCPGGELDDRHSRPSIDCGPHGPGS
jgi:integrase